MYIFPDGRIYCLQNVPLNPNSEDTFLFTGANDTEAYNNQFNYFYSKRNSSLDMLAQSYTRVGDGIIRAPGKADDYYAVNYIMFQNHAHGNKWFYAFITKVEYVNEGTTRLHFTIDPIQTYLYNYHTTECFVERMSTPTDGIGEWMAPEMVSLGEYTYNANSALIGDSFAEKRIILMYVDPTTTTGGYYDDTYSAATLKVYDPVTDKQTLESFLNNTTTVHDAIIGMYMVPAAVVGNQSGGTVLEQVNSQYSKTHAFAALTGTEGLDGYVPRNKKLYTFPYNFLTVYNGTGQSMVYRYEFFTNLTARFMIRSCILPPVEMQIIPLNYKNQASGNQINRLTMANFPMCSWSQDAYAAWWALNSESFVIDNLPKMLTTAGFAGGSAVMGNALGAVAGVASLASQITGMMSLDAKLNQAADLTSGTYNSGNVAYSIGAQEFRATRTCITGNYAKRIDDYFTAYGYAIGTNRKPDRNNRSRFTYVKTAGCNVYGNIPVDDALSIARMYDRGIRFWKDTTNFCNYSLGNPI